MKFRCNGRASLHAKLTLVYTIVIVLLVVIAGLIYGLMTTTSIRSYAAAQAEQSARTFGVTLADALILENQGALRARGEAAHATMSTLEQRAAAGTSSEDAVRQLAVQVLASQQIGENGYFFVVDSNADVAYHPVEEIRNENQIDTPIVKRILEQQAGFVRYSWRNPSEAVTSDKYGYIAYFAPWDWYVVATDYAGGFLERLPPARLQSLLNGYQQGSVLGVAVRATTGDLIGVSDGWDEVSADAAATSVWSRVSTEGQSVERTESGRYLALASLAGFEAEVGVVFSAARLSGLTTRYIYSVLGVLAVAVGVIYLSSRIVGKYISQPVRLMSERLNRRLPDARHSRQTGGDDLQTLVLQQLRALVRLDYETKGRRAAERDAMVAETVFTNTTEGILVTDADSVIIRVNPAFESISGYSATELIGANPRILKSKRQAPEFYEEMWESLKESGSWVGEVWNRRKDGDEYPGLLSIRAVHEEASGRVESYVAVCHDISDRKETEDRLHHLATHDELTGLPNRAYLNDVLTHTVRQAERYRFTIAVLFLDIDDFKDVNDSYGHETGDQLLRWIARRLEYQLRSEDIVVRFGGDEFVIVLPRIEDSEYASVVARRILAAVREPYMIGSQKIRPSVSIGIAVFPEAGRAAEELLRDADAAMYAAKRQGRNTYRFHNPGMNENAHRRLAMQGSVAAAIDRGEFVAVYQPILAVETGTIYGAEALVRWNHDGRLV
ncbi:MAG: diguanylate cyclase domain-containing protein, partial [Spirochaetota bacterium]